MVSVFACALLYRNVHPQNDRYRKKREDDGTKEQDAVAFVIVCASSDNSYHRQHQCFSDFRIETGIGLCVVCFSSS